VAETIAVVMAGGLGTRLRSLTVAVPKPLLPVGSRAILEIILRQIQRAGIERVYVSIGYRGYLVKAFLRDLAIDGLCIEVLEEDEPLGTAGALALLPPGDEDVFSMNGDVLTRAPIAEAIASHAASTASLTMLVHRHPVPLPYGLVDTDGARVLGIQEKPTVDFRVATGMYLVRRSVIDALKVGERVDMPDLITSLIAGGQEVRSFEFHELWTDVADLADYEKVNLNSSEWEDL
jgi:NDP-sugar pyrophosphorylase family protein